VYTPKKAAQKEAKQNWQNWIHFQFNEVDSSVFEKERMSMSG
jgi:hypothetical protein